MAQSLTLSSISLFCLLFFTILLYPEDKIVVCTKQIFLEECPEAFNPSMIRVENGYLFVFRYLPDKIYEPWISYIGVVMLNDAFDPIEKPQFLSVRRSRSKTPSQSEDPRVFSYRGRTFIVFNDNLEIENPTLWQRRDMFLAELFYVNNHYLLSSPIKLIHDTKYNTQWWQKNWFPFEWNNELYFVYMMNPHEIVLPNLIKGNCYPMYETTVEIDWVWGDLRGGTPAQLVDGEYLSFFHSSIPIPSAASMDSMLWHYYMGAYTFSPDPPFTISKITPSPIIAEGFYASSTCEKRVIFPGGFVQDRDFLHVAYGKDDQEMWIATLDKKKLMSFLQDVEFE